MSSNSISPYLRRSDALLRPIIIIITSQRRVECGADTHQDPTAVPDPIHPLPLPQTRGTSALSVNQGKYSRSSRTVFGSFVIILSLVLRKPREQRQGLPLSDPHGRPFAILLLRHRSALITPTRSIIAFPHRVHERPLLVLSTMAVQVGRLLSSVPCSMEWIPLLSEMLAYLSTHVLPPFGQDCCCCCSFSARASSLRSSFLTCRLFLHSPFP